MKKTILLFTGLLICLFNSLAQDLIPVIIDEGLEDFSKITAFFPREEGSGNEKKLFTFLEKKLAELDLEFSRFSFNNSINHHSFSSALSVKLNGSREDTLLLTIPVNHPYQVNNNADGSINIELGLALLTYLKSKKLPVSLQINFMGAEFGNSAEYPLGSNLYLEHYFPEYPVMHLYLNLRNIPGRLSIKCGGKNIVSPYWMITACTEALKKTNVPFLIRGNENQLFRFGINPGSNNIEPYLSRDIPSLSFEGDYTELTAGERKNWLLNTIHFFEIFLFDFTNGIPAEWDRHYLFFQVKSFFFILNEQVYLIAMIIILGLTIMYVLIFSKLFKQIIKIFFRNFWQLLVIFALTFFYLLLAGLLIRALSLYRGNPGLWLANPLLFLLLKISLVFFFYFLFKKLVKFLPFTAMRAFYSSAGLIMIFLNILIMAIINISFTYYFLWGFLFCLLSNILKNKWLRLLFFLPSTYWIIKTTIEFFIAAQPVFCETVLFSSIPQNLIIAAIILPFILYSVSIIKKWNFRLDDTLSFLTGLSCFLLCLGISVYLAIFNPYSPQNLQQVTVNNIINTTTQSNILELTAAGSLGKLNIWIEDQHFYLESKANTYLIPLDYLPDLLEVKNEQRAFLDRKNINLSVITRQAPYRVSLLITSDKEFTLFDANFPFRRQQKGTQYEILIGINPSNPLPLQLTLPAGHSFSFQLTVKYRNFPFKFELAGLYKNIVPKLILEKQLRIDT